MILLREKLCFLSPKPLFLYQKKKPGGWNIEVIISHSSQRSEVWEVSEQSLNRIRKE